MNALAFQREYTLGMARLFEDLPALLSHLRKQSGERFAELLRTEFLERREDVAVSVTGVGGRVLELRYAGFGDVYLHHFRKQTTLAEIRAAGFHTVTMTDGYEWEVTLDP